VDTTEPINAAADTTERLHLADWRRRISGLYGEVRELAATDPARAWDHWRATREQLYRGHPSSPVPATARGAFTGRYFAYDPRLRFELPVQPAGAGSGHATSSGHSPTSGSAGLLPISVGRAIAFDRIGYLDVPFDAGVRQLTLFWLPEYAGGLFLPFRDASNGTETYGGGRYLIDGAKGADLGGDPARPSVVVDFNFAYQPSCAFDPKWSCPLSPPDNRLDIPIAAGERLK
jgi:uncharacterized protein